MRHPEIHQRTARASSLLKAIGNERRLAILDHLSDGERSVGELCGLIQISQSALSQHLAKLRQHGVVRTRRDAQSVYYSIASEEARQVLDLVQDLFGMQPAGNGHHDSGSALPRSRA